MNPMQGCVLQLAFLFNTLAGSNSFLFHQLQSTFNFTVYASRMPLAQEDEGNKYLYRRN